MYHIFLDMCKDTSNHKILRDVNTSRGSKEEITQEYEKVKEGWRGWTSAISSREKVGAHKAQATKKF